MLVIIKSGPDTSEGKRGMALAKDMSADVVLMQNGVYFARTGLSDFKGTVHILDEDLTLRGLGDAAVGNNMKKFDYNALVVLMAESEKVVGMF